MHVNYGTPIQIKAFKHLNQCKNCLETLFKTMGYGLSKYATTVGTRILITMSQVFKTNYNVQYY